jgi:putative SOS response-associated peptidase YedK
MCGRTSLAVDPAVLEELFDVHVGVDYRPRYNIAPSDDLLAVRNDDPGEATLLEWGFVPHWVDDPSDAPTPINARSETVHEKRLFEESFRERRCVVFADGFYEWQGQRGNKQPYRIERRDREPFTFAGLWDVWEPADAPTRATCTILTTDANAVVGEVHDRMPVMLERGEESTWLSGDGPMAWRSVLDAYPDDLLRAYPVSKRVNSPANDDASLLEEVDIGSQSGLDEF